MGMKERWLVIHELLHQATQRGHQVGRTKLQKLIYFVQQFGADLDYRFELHQYGPYSYDLAGDLSVLESLEVIQTDRDQSGYGYQISDLRRPDGVPDRLLRRSEEALRRVIEKFAPLTVQQLEVMATIHFVTRALDQKKERSQRADVVKIVKSLKPMYGSHFIEEQYSQLSSLGVQLAHRH